MFLGTSWLPEEVEEMQQESETIILEKQRSIGIQVWPSFRRKYVECKLKLPVKHSAVSPMHVLREDTATSPMKVKALLFQPSSNSEESYSGSQSSSFTSSTSAETSDINIEDKEELENRSFNVTHSRIEQNAKFYLGVPNHWSPHLVNFLSV